MKSPTPRQVLQFVGQNRKPFVTTADVSGEFPEVSSKTIRDRLNSLVEKEMLNVRQVGANSKVWYIKSGRYSDIEASESLCFPESESQ